MKNPAPFCYDLNNVKAIVLGADPTNFSDHGSRKELTNVFGIGSGDPRYFKVLLKNLETVNLNIFDVYVQNMIPEYLDKVTAENKEWEKIAEKWLPILEKELDVFDPDKKIPILVTAERVLKFLSLASVPEAGNIYSGQEPGIVEKKNSKLERKLIPFYRHYKYSLEKDNNPVYCKALRNLF